MNLTPVQSYIQQARKTSDLFAGSLYLTELMNFLLNQLKKELPTSKILIPDVTIKSKPNMIMLEVETDEVTLHGTLTKIEENLQLNISDEIYIVNNRNTQSTLQTKEIFNLYWVYENREKEDLKHQDIVRMHQKLLSVKKLRKFCNTSEAGRKCNLCGERNQIIYHKNNTNHEAKTFLNPGEGLCSVCYHKRKKGLKVGSGFPSVAEISAATAINAIKDSELNVYRVLEYDCQLLHEENLTSGYLSRYLNIDPQNINLELNNMNQELRTIKKFLGDKYNINSYYALLMLDGDNMGKWMSGEYIKEDENLEKYLHELSSSMGKFSEKLYEIVQNEKGRVVYAGGDDLLAFINLDYLFPVLEDIRKAFKNIVSDNIQEYLKTSKEITLSGGVVVAHYKHPLSDVITHIHQAEKAAKTYRQAKNCLNMTVLKHSGEITTTNLPWNINTDETMMILEKIRIAQKENFSYNYLNIIDREFAFLNHLEEIDINLLKPELDRTIKRSYLGNPKDKSNKCLCFAKELIKLLEYYVTETLEQQSMEKLRFSNFISIINILKFICRNSNNLEERSDVNQNQSC